jgi:hypothetical protein
MGLLAAAGAEGFQALITADRNMQYQQSLVSRHIALIVLGTNHWNTIRGNVQALVEAVPSIEGGLFRRGVGGGCQVIARLRNALSLQSADYGWRNS